MSAAEYDNLSPEEKARQEREEKVTGVLVNVFGVKLPTECLLNQGSVLWKECLRNFEPTKK